MFLAGIRIIFNNFFTNDALDNLTRINRKRISVENILPWVNMDESESNMASTLYP